MDEINTEQQFKDALLRCAQYMLKIGEARSVSMDIGKAILKLDLTLK